MRIKWRRYGTRSAAAALLIWALLVWSGCGTDRAPLYINGEPVTAEELTLLDGDVDRAARMKLLQQLAVECGAAEPFSYPEMIRQMEMENKTRAQKAASGETVYGLLEYTPLQYYSIWMDRCERAIKDQWIDGAGQDELLAYYEAHLEDYRQIGEITAYVRLGVGGRTVDEQEIVLSAANYRTLSEGNEELVWAMESLELGGVQSWTDGQGIEWTVTCTDRTADTYAEFDDVRGAVSEQWASMKLEEELEARAAASSVRDLR